MIRDPNNPTKWRMEYDENPRRCPICGHKASTVYLSGDRMGKPVEYDPAHNIKKHIVIHHIGHNLWKKTDNKYDSVICRLGPRIGEVFPTRDALTNYYVDGLLDGLFLRIDK